MRFPRIQRRRWCACSRASDHTGKRNPACWLHGTTEGARAYQDGRADGQAEVLAALTSNEIHEQAVAVLREHAKGAGTFEDDVRALLDAVAATIGGMS